MRSCPDTDIDPSKNGPWGVSPGTVHEQKKDHGSRLEKFRFPESRK